MKIKCEVFRRDPDVDTGSRYDTYLLEAEPTETVLDALIKIYRDHDAALSFRFACGVIKCGECAIVVNGTPCLGCEKMVAQEMKIDPLPDLPLIKDLVIDRRRVFDRIFALLPSLSETRGTKEGLKSLDSGTANRCVQLTKCFECLICQSSCPVAADQEERFVGPLGLLWLAQGCEIPGNASVPRREIEAALEPCTRCGICSDVCPCSEDILGLALDTLEKG